MGLQEIGALWLKKDKRGNKMLSGILKTDDGDLSILILKNTRKEIGSKHPDYRIYIRTEDDNNDLY